MAAAAEAGSGGDSCNRRRLFLTSQSVLALTVSAIAATAKESARSLAFTECARPFLTILTGEKLPSLPPTPLSLSLSLSLSTHLTVAFDTYAEHLPISGRARTASSRVLLEGSFIRSIYSRLLLGARALYNHLAKILDQVAKKMFYAFRFLPQASQEPNPFVRLMSQLGATLFLLNSKRHGGALSGRRLRRRARCRGKKLWQLRRARARFQKR